MTTDLRDKDIAVLQALHDGAETVSEIKEATTLSNREINYSLTEKSLENHGLVTIHRRDGREWREINGHEQYVWQPKQVELTDQGIHTLTELSTNNHGYEDMTKRELIEELNELQDRVDRLETMFKDFRNQNYGEFITKPRSSLFIDQSNPEGSGSFIGWGTQVCICGYKTV